MARQKKENSAAVLGFEDKLWQAAVLMRGKLPATQYWQVLMGLLFLRYVSDAFEKRFGELKAEGFGDEEDRDAYLKKNIFFVPKDMLGNVIDLFTNELSLSDVEANRDLLGRTYEYCIEHFAEYEGKKGGEYYTPESIVRTLVEVLQPESGKRVYDPCCGSGGMFVQQRGQGEERSALALRSVAGRQRDALLPKLMSGELAVEKVEVGAKFEDEDGKIRVSTTRA